MHASVPLTQALDESVTDDEPAGSQTQDSNQMEAMMNMLVDLSYQLQATEESMRKMREKVATYTLSSPTSHVD